jgi:hypothetical protein
MDIATECSAMKWARRVLLVAISLGVTVPSALAAEIVPVKGEVLANTGTGYQPVGGRMKLNEGDSVIVAPGAQGSLVYADGCTLEVVPGMVAWVEPKPPCSEGRASAAAPPPLAPTKTFKRDWLVGGAAQLKRTTIPAGP